jgi:hypothetical protein
MRPCTPSAYGRGNGAGVLVCLEMKKEKIPKPDDFAPLPKKAVLVEEAEFDKVIAQLLKSSSIGIYEIKSLGKRSSKKHPSSRG